MGFQAAVKTDPAIGIPGQEVVLSNAYGLLYCRFDRTFTGYDTGQLYSG